MSDVRERAGRGIRRAGSIVLDAAKEIGRHPVQGAATYVLLHGIETIPEKHHDPNSSVTKGAPYGQISSSSIVPSLTDRQITNPSEGSKQNGSIDVNVNDGGKTSDYNADNGPAKSSTSLKAYNLLRMNQAKGSRRGNEGETSLVQSMRQLAGADYGTPQVIGKGKNNDNTNVEIYPSDVKDHILFQIAQSADDVSASVTGFVLGGLASACAAPVIAKVIPTPTRIEQQQGSPTPTIIPFVEEKDRTYANNLLAMVKGPVSDVGSGITPEAALIRKFRNTVGALIENDKNLGLASDFNIILPISPEEVTNWVNNPANEPAWYIQKIDNPRERYFVTVNKYYNEAGFLPMPAEAIFEKTAIGTTDIIIPGSGGWNELIDLPQLDRHWMPQAGMFLDLSNIPRNASDISSEIKANMNYSYGFARKIYDMDPYARIDQIPSINNKGEVVFAARVKFSSGQEVIYGQARQPLYHNFYQPSLNERQGIRLGNDGTMIRQDPGNGMNAGEKYDSQIWDPDTQSYSNLPSAVPTVVPSATPLPTLAPSATPSPLPTLTPTLAPKTTEPPPPSPIAKLEATVVPPLKSWVGPAGLDTLSNISYDNPSWYGLTNNGAGIADSIIDPQIGPAVKYTVKQVRGDNDPARVYPSIVFPSLESKDGPFNWEFGYTFILGPGYLPKVPGQWISLGGNFSSVLAQGGENQVIMGIDVYEANTIKISPKTPNIAGQPPSQEWKEGVGRSKRILQEGVPYNMVVRNKNGILTVELNGEMWATGKVHPNFTGVDPVMYHSGLYEKQIPIGAWLINGPMTVKVSK